MMQRTATRAATGGYSRPAWQFGELLQGQIALPGRFDSAAQLQITNLTADSGDARPGALFLACSGGAGHGLEHVREAKRRGAVAVLAESDAGWSDKGMRDLAAELELPVLPVAQLGTRLSTLADRFFDSPSHDLEVCGVTGSHGKTSLCHYLAGALSTEYRCGFVSDLGSGFPDTAPSEAAAADGNAIWVQRQLAKLRARGAYAAVLETSFDDLCSARFSGVRFRHAVLTGDVSLGPRAAHQRLSTMADASRRLFASRDLDWAIFHADDPLASELLPELAPGVSIGAYSLHADAVVPERCDLWLRARALHAQRGGLRLEIESQGRGQDAYALLEMPVLGACGAANLLGAVTFLHARGFTLERACEMVKPLPAVPGRMECFGDFTTPLAVVDRACTVAAMESVFSHLRVHRPRRILSVMDLDSAGDTAESALMLSLLRAAGRLSACLIVSSATGGDTPRAQRVAELLAQLPDAVDCRLVSSRALAIRHALAAAAPDDLVLVVAGESGRQQAPGGLLAWRFSDRAEIMQALNEWRGGIQ